MLINLRPDHEPQPIIGGGKHAENAPDDPRRGKRGDLEPTSGARRLADGHPRGRRPPGDLTHAAYTTGKYTHGFAAWCSRMEIGVPIFSCCRASCCSAVGARGGDGRSAAVGAPLRQTPGAAYHAGLRHHGAGGLRAVPLPHGGAQSRAHLDGSVRNLTLTQIYTDDYLFSYLHQGLTQMWSLAVEAAFYVALPLLAYLLLVVVCRGGGSPRGWCSGWRRWRVSPAWLVLVQPTTLPDGAPLWLPTYLMWFLGGMLLAALRPLGVEATRCACRWRSLLLHRLHPDRGCADHVARRTAGGVVQCVFYAVISTLAVAPLALGTSGW